MKNEVFYVMDNIVFIAGFVLGIVIHWTFILFCVYGMIDYITRRCSEIKEKRGAR